MSAHTPGPWITNGCVVSARVALSQRDVCTVSASAPARGETYNIAKHLPELQANARLIAAAPQLYAAVCHAEAWISDMPHGENCFLSDCYDGDPGNQCNCGKEGMLAALQEAIAKAVQP